MSSYKTKWFYSCGIFFFMSSILLSQSITTEEKKALIQKIEREYKEKDEVGYNTVCCNSSATNVLLAVMEEREDWALKRNLGYLYYLYYNDKHRDKENAKRWLKKQADYGDPSAQYSWAQEHGYVNSSTFKKLKLPNDPETHVTYLKKSYDATKFKGRLNKLSGAYREYENYEMLLETLKELVIIDGSAFNIWRLSSLYRNGKGTQKDINKANSLLKRSADLGYDYAQSRYGSYLFYGTDGVKKNSKKGIEYLQKAIKAGDCQAYFILVDNAISPNRSLKCKRGTTNYSKTDYYYSKNRKLHKEYDFSNPKSTKFYQGDNKSLKAEIVAGKYILTNKSDRDYIKFVTHQKGSKNAAITDLDYSKDFDIEMKAKFVKTPKSTVLSLLMGSEWRNEKLIVNFELLALSNLNSFGAFFSGEKTITPHKAWTPLTSSSFGPDFYRLTFRKIGDMSYYFINKELVFQKKFKPFSGDNFGVLISGETTIAIDSYSFYYY